MNRRRFLSLCGAAVAGAGCQGDAGDTSTVTPVPSPAVSERTRQSGTTVRVTGAAVVPGVVLPGEDSISVATTDGQYLVLTVGVEGAGLDRSAFSVRFDGSAYAPESFRNGLYRDGTWGKRFTESGGPLVFALPETGSADDVQLTWPDGAWSPPASVRGRLEAPLPSFDVTLDGPTRVAEGEDPTLEIRVTNTGDVAGRYVLALNRIGPRVAYAPAGRFDGELEPGETDVRSHAAKSPYDGGVEPSDVTYKLDAPGQKHDATLTVVPAADTPTES